MFRYQSFQAKLVSKAAGDVPPYPLTLADNGNLLLDFKTFTLYFLNLFFLGISSFWYYYVSEYDSSFPQRMLKLFCLSPEIHWLCTCLCLYLCFICSYICFFVCICISDRFCRGPSVIMVSTGVGVTFTFEDCLRAASAATHISGNNQKKTKNFFLEKYRVPLVVP